MNGSMKNRICLLPETTPRLKESVSPFAIMCEISVNMVVVMGTVRKA